MKIRLPLAIVLITQLPGGGRRDAMGGLPDREVKCAAKLSLQNAGGRHGWVKFRFRISPASAYYHA